MAKIKRFGVIKMASFMGLYGAFIGLIMGIIFAIVSSLINALFSSATSSVGAVSFGGVGWFSIILFPLAYGIIGFILGLILTPIMNLILKIIKGLDLEIEEGNSYDMQEQPQQYHPSQQQYQYQH